MKLRYAYHIPSQPQSVIVLAAPKEAIESVKGKKLTDQEYKDFVRSRSIPADATEILELPEDWEQPDRDRTFRNSWKHSGGKFSVDMATAQEETRNIIRGGRDFSKLDADYFKAQEAGDTKAIADIVSQKQSLRDAPQDPAIDAAQTTDELRAVLNKVP